MLIDFGLDLTRLRRQSGLTQDDLAHLLDVNSRKIWKLEKGRIVPTLEEVCLLSLIYGRTFERLYETLLNDARTKLDARLGNLPRPERTGIGARNRTATLNRLAERLVEEHADDAA